MCSLLCPLNFEPCDTEVSRSMRQRFLRTGPESACITLTNFPLARTGDVIYQLAARELGSIGLPVCSRQK